MPIPPNGFRGLQVVLNLRKIGIGITLVHQCVEIIQRLPDAHRAALLRQVLLLFLAHEIHGLMRVVEPVELAHPGRRSVVVLAEVFLFLVLLIALSDEIVPLLEVLKRAHSSSLSQPRS